MKNVFEIIPFPEEEVKQTVIFKDEETLLKIQEDSPEPPTLEKISRVYGDVYFPKAPENRPYTFASIVVSVDGKIAFEDSPQGPVIAGKNLRDPDGGFSDFWVLNMLRYYADGVVIGARTMQTEPTMTAECFDDDLASQRVPYLKKRHRCPIHIIVSFDGTDIPFDHVLFDADSLFLIATSPQGLEHVKKNSSRPVIDLGSYADPGQLTLEACRTFEKAENGNIFVIGTGEENRPDAKTLLLFLRRAGLTRLLIEAPSYMTHLLGMEAMDEMFMNYSTVFAGGSIGFGNYQHFSAEDHPHSDFLQINRHSKNFIYTRQRIIYNA